MPKVRTLILSVNCAILTENLAEKRLLICLVFQEEIKFFKLVRLFSQVLKTLNRVVRSSCNTDLRAIVTAFIKRRVGRQTAKT